MKKSILAGVILMFAGMSTGVFAQNTEIKAIGKTGKTPGSGNPISANIFCADPTAVEYEGRLYVYGTNDHEQYLKASKNSYEKIKTLTVFSTDDMVNWEYHGEINVGEVAPWIINSWAPSIISRVEADGLTHFYLYFSNNGLGVGVITATNPLGPWSDPLGEPLIRSGMPGLDSPNPFDPGVIIDDKGDGYLAFGGGVTKSGSKQMPKSSKIIKLGKDMVSIDSDFVTLEAPYFFEASELNFINGTYVYTFNHSWDKNPLGCSMGWMTSKTPLDSASWKYQGVYFKNPGEMGFDYGNNHTHLQKFNGKWYLFYHTQSLAHTLGIQGGFRSLCVNEINVDEANVVIKSCTGNTTGTAKIKDFDPYRPVPGTEYFSCASMGYSNSENPKEIRSTAAKKGAWFMVKNVDFEKDVKGITAAVSGTGRIQVRLDKYNGKSIATLECPGEGTQEVSVDFTSKAKITGVHDVYFVFSDEGAGLKFWQAYKN